MSKTKSLLFVPTWLTKSRLAFLLFALALLTMPTAVTLAQSGEPELTIPDQVSASPNSQVTVAVNYTANGANISATTFSVDYDQTLLTLDPTDSDADGTPDAVTLNIPAGFGGSVTFDASDTDGELDFFFADTFPPLASLPDGQIASITFNVGDPSSTTEAAVNFSQDPVTSFGNTSGQSVTGTTDDGSVLINVSGPTPPVADFACTPTSGPASLEVTCTDASTGDITDWSWNFGDSTTSADQNPAAHTYSANGSYDVTLTVTGPGGSDTQTRTGYILVSDSTGNVVISLISEGLLSVTWHDVIFPETVLAGQDVLAYAIDETWQAEDTTQLGEGWLVTVVATDHLRGSQDPDNRIIPVGSNGNFAVACVDNEITTVSGDNTNSPLCSSGVQPVPIMGESPQSILSAADGEGMGVYDFVPHFQLLVPNTTVIDTYTTSINVAIIASP